MNRLTKLAVFSGLSLAIAGGSVHSVFAQNQAKTDRVAVVNGTTISKKAFDRRLAQVRQQMVMRGKHPETINVSKLKADVLENLIDYELLYLASRDKGFKPEATAVDKEWQKYKARFPNDEQLQKVLQMILANLRVLCHILLISKTLRKSLQTPKIQEYSQTLQRCHRLPG